MVDGGDYIVGNDRGGYVVEYFVRARKIEAQGKRFVFNSKCRSACTLYLVAKRKCIKPGASFVFHAAWGSKDNKQVTDWMYGQYPGWVRSWINSQGGLSGRLITMPYGYASKFLPA